MEESAMQNHQSNVETWRQAREEEEARRGPDDAENQARRERLAHSLGWPIERVIQMEDRAHEANVAERAHRMFELGREQAVDEQRQATPEDTQTEESQTDHGTTQDEIEERRQAREQREADEQEWTEEQTE